MNTESNNLESFDIWIETQMEEYRSLRTEIITAIQTQRATLALALLTMGGVFTIGLQFWCKPILHRAIFMFLAPITSWTFVVIWLAEVMRILRAAHFLRFIETRVENEFKKRKIKKPLAWQRWLANDNSLGHSLDRKLNYFIVIFVLDIVGFGAIFLGFGGEFILETPLKEMGLLLIPIVCIILFFIPLQFRTIKSLKNFSKSDISALDFVDSDKPTIYIITGLPGSGKTEVSKQIALQKRSITINTDDVFLSLFPKSDYDEFGGFPPSKLSIVYSTLPTILKYILKSGWDGAIIFDGSFRKKKQRTDIIKLAESYGIKCNIVYVTAKESLIKERLEERFKNNAQPTQFQTYLNVQKDYEKPNKAFVIENSDGIANLKNKVTSYLIIKNSI